MVYNFFYVVLLFSRLRSGVPAAGHITPDELRQALDRAGGYSPEEVQDILKKVDKDKDGSIDYEEFVAMMVPKQSDDPVRRRKKTIKF